MESLYFSKIIVNESDLGKSLEIFAYLPGGKSTGPGEFNLFYISPLNSSNFILIHRAKLDSHRGTSTGCIYTMRLKLNIYIYIYIYTQKR